MFMREDLPEVWAEYMLRNLKASIRKQLIQEVR